MDLRILLHKRRKYLGIQLSLSMEFINICTTNMRTENQQNIEQKTKHGRGSYALYTARAQIGIAQFGQGQPILLAVGNRSP